MGDVAAALAPIDAHLRATITQATYLQTDDTPITVLTDDGPGSYKGRLWVYLDPIAARSSSTPRTHERDGPERSLASFTGVLQADAYSGYDALYRNRRIVEAGCWAHARRRFVEAFSTDSGAARTLALIQQLYEVERGDGAAQVAPRRSRPLPDESVGRVQALRR